MHLKQKITPFLWFDSQAEEAARFYVSLFDNSELLGVTRHTEAAPRPTGSVMTVSFRLDGVEFTALNGGPVFQFTEAVSFSIACDSQEEVDRLWEALSAGGEKGQCGWLKDKFGVSWQVVPTALYEMAQDPDPARVERVMAAMLQMTKLDIAKLREAYDRE
jgi:predicted 3-demethylubiquinone-9 3-methyltransferase (glyoxalase superfamily)